VTTSYHIHSTFSDGRNSVPEIVAAAAAVGLDEVGISDHLVLLGQDRRVTWSMSVDDLPDYFDAIEHAAANAPPGLTVRRGLEIDFIPEAMDRVADIVGRYPVDYVIGSVHFFDGFPIDECRERWDHISEAERNDIIRGYWGLIARMARTGMFDIAGHLDLYKKFGHLPTADMSEEIITAIDAIAESGMSVELNTSGWHKPIMEAYPSPMILKGCLRRQIPVIITSDAHTTSRLTDKFDRAAGVLGSLGWDKTATYSGRKRVIVRA
jgi:histidinol-phosphatase (PHP family)